MKLELSLLFLLIVLFLSTFLMLGYVMVRMDKDGAKCIQDPMNYTMEKNEGVVCGCYKIIKP